MNLSKNLQAVIVAGILFASYVCYVLVMMNNHALPWWNFAYGVLFCVCLILALACLGIGFYFIHFGWTFWIFKQPTLMDRILAVLNPRIFIFTFAPVFWLSCFLRPKTRVLFQA